MVWPTLGSRTAKDHIRLLRGGEGKGKRGREWKGEMGMPKLCRGDKTPWVKTDRQTDAAITILG